MTGRVRPEALRSVELGSLPGASALPADGSSATASAAQPPRRAPLTDLHSRQTSPALRQRRPQQSAPARQQPAQDAPLRLAHLPLLHNTAEQRALRNRFAEWAQAAELKRHEQLSGDYRAVDAAGAGDAGSADHHQSRWRAISQDIGGKLRAASLDALQAAISSASRSGGSNLVDGLLADAAANASARAAQAPRSSTVVRRIAELDNPLDVRVISGGFGGGLGALAGEGLVKALDRARAAGGKVSLQPVDVNALVPRACPVEAGKVYLPGGGVAYAFTEKPLSALIREEADLQKTRDNLRLLQSMASGSSAWGSLIHPAAAGAAAIGRNAAAGHLLNAGAPAGGVSFGFSYLGRLGSRSVESLLQISLTTEQDGLAPGGATQKLPLFKLNRASPTGPADQAPLPRRVLGELGSLLKESTGQSAASVSNVLAYALANASANVTSTGVGQIYAQSLDSVRDNRGLQQFINSSVNDFVWQLVKTRFEGALSNLGAELDAKTASAACALIETQTTQLHGECEQIAYTQRRLGEIDRELRAGTSSAQAAVLSRQRHALQQLHAHTQRQVAATAAEIGQRIDDARDRLAVPADLIAQLRARLPQEPAAEVRIAIEPQRRAGPGSSNPLFEA
jgi:hypothetical protein